MTLFTLPQAARTLQISLRSVRRLVETGALPVVRLGRLVRIDPADLAAMKKTQTLAEKDAYIEVMPIATTEKYDGNSNRGRNHQSRQKAA